MTEETKAMEIEKEEALPAEGTERTRECPCFVPRADIYRKDEVIVVVVDMPGAASDSIDITLEKNVLTINGTVGPHRPEGYSLVWAEYEDGDFLRRFTLSDEIDREAIEATLKDGVLRLHLPIADVARTRKISVKAG